MKRIIYGALALFCAQHLLRDILQQIGVKDWYTTLGHNWTRFINDTPRNNYLGMLIFLWIGMFFMRLALGKPDEA